MNEKEATELSEFLTSLAQICVSNSQKVEAVEKVLQKNSLFAEAYRQELEKTKARGQQSSIALAIERLKQALNQEKD